MVSYKNSFGLTYVEFPAPQSLPTLRNIKRNNRKTGSSASHYASNAGLIDIEIVDCPVVDVLKKSSKTKYIQY